MYKTLLLIFTMALFSTIANAGKIKEVADGIIKQSPETAFEEALKANDYRLITIPFCGGITPGFKFMEYRGNRPEENNLGLSCHALLGNEEIKALKELENWVTKYNSLMFKKLNKQ